MKIMFTKCPGGVLSPATDLEADKLTRFKTGEVYEVEIKLSRNAKFHAKMFAFFNFCFEHWDNHNEFQCEQKSFNVFRSHLTVLAGYHDSFVGIDGRVRVEAKSISYSAMDPEEFETLYNALIRAALKHVFKSADELTSNKLMNFF